MQRGKTLNQALCQHCPFSILGRIGGDATRVPGQNAQHHAPHFQYPRSDRRRCNYGNPHFTLGTFTGFQYPRSDRRRCNRCGPVPGAPAPGLSVSSVGSEAMQLLTKNLLPGSLAPFSILGRIGGDATTDARIRHLIQALFQYPRSDRRRCNDRTAPRGVAPADFQYPRSDRRRCNSNGRQGKPPHSRPFSILGRIGGDATFLRQERLLPEGLRLSVSSVGSEAMQPGGPGRRAGRRPPFSILGRIGGDAT